MLMKNGQKINNFLGLKLVDKGIWRHLNCDNLIKKCNFYDVFNENGKILSNIIE
jgi:hypothetical protein